MTAAGSFTLGGIGEYRRSRDRLDQRTRVGVTRTTTGPDVAPRRSPSLRVEPQAPFRPAGLGGVALVALIDKDRPDLRLEERTALLFVAAPGRATQRQGHEETERNAQRRRGEGAADFLCRRPGRSLMVGPSPW